MGVVGVRAWRRRASCRKRYAASRSALLVAAMAACSTSGKSVDPNVSLQQALADYFAGNVTLAKREFKPS